MTKPTKPTKVEQQLDKANALLSQAIAEIERLRAEIARRNAQDCRTCGRYHYGICEQFMTCMTDEDYCSKWSGREDGQSISGNHA